MTKTKKQEEKPIEKVDLTQKEIVEGMTNDPAFNPDEVTLKDKVYKIAHLEYDDFSKFTSYFEPMLRKILAKMKEIQDTAVTEKKDVSELANVDVMELLKECADNLPLMGQLILKQTQPDITVEEVKKICGDPFTITELVLLQMAKNRMVEKFSAFFPHLMSLIRW